MKPSLLDQGKAGEIQEPEPSPAGSNMEAAPASPTPCGRAERAPPCDSAQGLILQLALLTEPSTLGQARPLMAAMTLT